MSMGFQEMPTNKWVESSFWNFDALFQPQSHPARDAHDTFFVKEPKECLTVCTLSSFAFLPSFFFVLSSSSLTQ